jgi:hypothetical protein
VTDSCEQNNKTPVFINGREFVEELIQTEGLKNNKLF